MALTTAQIATVKAAIAAETDPTFVANRTAGATGAMADFYDQNHPTFIVWKSSVSLVAIGNAFNGTEFSGLTSANVSRLSAIADFSAAGVNPSTADRRQMFDDIFSGAGGTITRPALLALYKRPALRIEALFATGTGTSASPGTLVFEGAIRNEDIVLALQ